MNSDSNTEMDLLLRRHARRGGASPHADASGGSNARAEQNKSSGAGAHLDADEMNAYVEGQLPAPARTRYMAHLADCDVCRGVVASLALAANLPLQDEEGAVMEKAAAAKGWREWLSALFAPPLVRYGVPALVLLMVVGIALLSQRDRREAAPTYVAKNEEQRAPQSATVTESPSGSPSELRSAEAPANNNISANVQTAKEKDSQQANVSPGIVLDGVQTSEAAPPAVSTGTTGAPAQTSTVTANEPETERAERAKRDEEIANRPEYRITPATPANPGGRAQEQAGTDRVIEDRRAGNTASRTSDAELARRDAPRESDSASTAAAAKAAPAPPASRRARGENRALGATREAQATGGTASTASTATETRSVGGKQFRRQGSAWVDSSYQAGRATVNVSRGSEQYRALTADEPGLRGIIEQLGGEVIVVWRGRAYRIH